MMTPRKRRRMRKVLLHSLAIGTSIAWGGLFGIADASEPQELRLSQISPTFLPVQAISAADESDDAAEFESSRRRVARRESPAPFTPPTATAKPQTPAAASPSASEPKMGTWVPRGSHSLRTSTARRFTPWMTPDIDRQPLAGSATESMQSSRSSSSSSEIKFGASGSRSESTYSSGGQTPPSLQHKPAAIVANPHADDPAPAPLPGTLSERSATTETVETTTESSRRTRISTRDTSTSTELRSSREAESMEILPLVPSRSPDSNEPVDDVAEPNELQPVPQEETTDGDIDAESLEKLRAAIRSFPERLAEREIDHDSANESSGDSGLRSADASAGKSSELPERQPRKARVLTRDVQALQPYIARVLTDYHRRPENVASRSPWGTFHLMLPFGADANVQSGRNLHNSIAWLCSNRPCRGQRLITTTKSGRIYIRQGPGLQGHQAQLLAMLAQVNVEATYGLTDGRTRFTVEDLIRAEMADCRRGQELTFSLIGLSHYLPTDTQWRASDGSVWSFETLLAEELAQPVVGAACGGTHRLMGLSYALRQRRMEGLPIEGQWLRAEAFVKDFVDYAWSLQNRDGSFSTNWFEGPQDNRDIDRKVQTTGHILEWLIFTADQDELQDPRFVRSAQFLTNAFTRYRTREWQPGPKGHVLRALALYHRRVYGDARPWAQPAQVAQPGRRSYR